MAKVLNDDSRFGFSALSLMNRRIAENDEMLLRKTDGQLLFKRSDGYLTSYYPDYTKDSLLDAVLGVIDGVSYPDSAVLVYNTIDIGGQVTMATKEFHQITNFPVLRPMKDASHFFIRFRGNEMTNSVISYLESKRHLIYPDESLDTLSAKINFYGTYGSQEKTFDMRFNQLTSIEHPITSGDELRLDTLAISMQKLSKFLELITSDELDKLLQLNYSNSTLEVSKIDIIYFTDNIDYVPIINDDEDVLLKMIIPVSDIINRMSYSIPGYTITPSKTEPNYKTIWAKPRG